MTPSEQKPLTISAERLREARAFAEIEGQTSALAIVFAELDAQGAAHAETRERLSNKQKAWDDLVQSTAKLLELKDEQLVQALKDTERMDWLDGDNWWDFSRAANPFEPALTFHLDIGEGQDCQTHSAKSAREAIDAALRAKPEGGRE